MSICKHCDAIAGYHKHWCTDYAPPARPRTRIEWFGSLQVHQPVKP